jgi:hypothetical protein
LNQIKQGIALDAETFGCGALQHWRARLQSSALLKMLPKAIWSRIDPEYCSLPVCRLTATSS